jgi:hypothetical protein
MTKRTTVITRLESIAESPQAKWTVDVLRDRKMEPVSDGPSSLTVAEALRLWKTRLENVKSTRQPIEGLSELINHLESLSPQKKLDQYGFTGSHSAAAIFFTRADGKFVGSAIALQD